MTKELFRICTGENHHKFGAEGGFKEIEICPYCQTHMDLVELTIDAKGKIRHPGDTLGAKRGLKIDTLPRMRWFSDAGELNETEQEHANELWVLKDAEELARLYHEIGIGDHKIWNETAEVIGRSLYAVERQLRMIIHCADELANWYPV
ncbi:hypothetical protein LCGC14_0815530 [marine sediment metagenome]|uniref:Uncharacterized protein n=1 Tax=marine sediment metagenome TaxID=412755 RepID=A0A0F9ST01_9ZZZZ